MDAPTNGQSPDWPLLLFDIDGTLIRTGVVAVRHAFAHAFRQVFGVELLHQRIDMSGMIDRQIIPELARMHECECTLDRVLQTCRSMAEYCRTADLVATPLPGIPELVASLHQAGFPLGILSGNVQEIGWLKLTAAGLREPFRFGAFGDEADARADLVPLAVERAKQTFGVHYPAEQVWIIGDTPRDVACARANGTKVVAVATGQWSVDQLSAHQPDAVFSDLTDAAAFLAAVGYPSSCPSPARRGE